MTDERWTDDARDAAREYQLHGPDDLATLGRDVLTMHLEELERWVSFTLTTKSEVRVRIDPPGAVRVVTVAWAGWLRDKAGVQHRRRSGEPPHAGIFEAVINTGSVCREHGQAQRQMLELQKVALLDARERRLAAVGHG